MMHAGRFSNSGRKSDVFLRHVMGCSGPALVTWTFFDGSTSCVRVSCRLFLCRRSSLKSTECNYRLPLMKNFPHVLNVNAAETLEEEKKATSCQSGASCGGIKPPTRQGSLLSMLTVAGFTWSPVFQRGALCHVRRRPSTSKPVRSDTPAQPLRFSSDHCVGCSRAAFRSPRSRYARVLFLPDAGAQRRDRKLGAKTKQTCGRFSK